MTPRAVAIAALLFAAVAGPARAQLPIPGPLDGPLPRFEGAPAAARPLPGPFPPQNPALAPDGRSGSGLAAGNGAASPLPGPLGQLPTRASAVMAGGCASLAFDARGRLLAGCNGPLGPSLRLLDPASLVTIATLQLPPRRNTDRTDLAGGTHFLVRADGTLLVPANDGTLLTVAVEDAALRQVSALSLGALLAPGERPFAVAAGFDGRDWVVGTNGTVIAVPRNGGPPRALALGEPVAEDAATDPSGVYVVTRDALYRIAADGAGAPHVIWRLPVPSGVPDSHAGRIHDGSGTPPAIVPGGYVAITDDVNPPRLMIARVRGGAARRLACSVPLFGRRPGSVEAQLVVAGRSVVATNAYGYDSLATTEGGRTTEGGIQRVLVRRRGCRTAWTSDEVSPSAQPVVSRATGLLYTIDKPAGFPDRWNLAALDWRTGKLRFRALSGEGLGFNSDCGAVVLGPDGAAYAGSFGGVERFEDIG
jgi:hypothetical protein